jgi:hypothetical protein
VIHKHLADPNEKHNNNSHLSSEFVNRDSDDGSENSESNHDNSKVSLNNF